MYSNVHIDGLYYMYIWIIRSIMVDFVYVVSLIGKHVHHNMSIQCVIRNLDILDKVRNNVLTSYGIEFEELSSHFYSGYLRFDNITDDRDISLVVERVSVID